MDSHYLELMNNFVIASVLGVVLFILANRLKISAIVLLLIGGIIAGPQVLGIVDPNALGDGLNTIIALAVGLILFEGGLTLDMKGFREVAGEIRGILTWGVLITWLTTAMMLYLLFGFSVTTCLVAASLVIVTGPTVIGPLLSRIRVKHKLHHILHWEGVLIDPIGVFIALLCYEWIISTTDGGTSMALLNFFSRFLVGTVLGLVFGLGIHQILKKNWIPEESINIFVLASAMLNIMLADNIVKESGLLSVTIAGLVLGYKDTPQLDKIIAYKVELKDFLIGLLFVLLAAKLDLTRFTDYGWLLLAAVAIMMFVVRPLNIFLSIRQSSGLTFKDKLFLSYIAPRGIVAASMASLFALSLGEKGMENAAFLETFTYSVIAATVLFQGFTAKFVGGWLGVLEPKPRGWLIIGSHKLARSIGKFIQEQGENVVLLDTNPREVKWANREGLRAYAENAMTIDPSRAEFYGVGNVLAITENEDLNRLLCQRWNKELDGARFFRWGRDESTNTAYSDLNVGQSVWNMFHLKSVLAHSDRGDDQKPRVVTIDADQVNTHQVLMSMINGDLHPHIPEGTSGEITVLTLQPVHDASSLKIEQEHVLFSRDGDLRTLYNEMLGRLEQKFPKLDTPTLLNELLKREEEFTSLIGHGISLPHTYTAAVDEPQVMVARIKPGIPCQHTGSDIELVFMLLSPEDQPVEHLNRISRIAKFVMKEQHRESLLHAIDEFELYDIINEA